MVRVNWTKHNNPQQTDNLSQPTNLAAAQNCRLRQIAAVLERYVPYIAPFTDNLFDLIQWQHGKAGLIIVIDWSNCSATESNPAIASGAWVIRGTRIPVAVIFENFESGATILELTEWFPGLTADNIRDVLRFAAKSAAA